MPDTDTGGTITVTVNPEFSKSFEDLLRTIARKEIVNAVAQLADILGVGLDEDLAHEINDSIIV